MAFETSTSQTNRTRDALFGWRNLIVAYACACNVAAVAATNYEQYLSIVRYRGAGASFPFDINRVNDDAIWLGPILIILIARRQTIVVVAYALALSAIFAGRIYYLLPPSLTGVDGLALKYDWSDLCLSFLGYISACASVVWLIVWLVKFAANVITRFMRVKGNSNG